MTSDEVFRAELQLYSRPPQPVPPSFVDLELSAQLGGVRLLFTNRFVTDVLVGGSRRSVQYSVEIWLHGVLQICYFFLGIGVLVNPITSLCVSYVFYQCA